MIQINTPKYVRQILFGLQARGHFAYLVGGCVRDMIMDITPQDWDICTSALPEEILEIFPGSIPTGIKHGTVTVVIGTHSAEVTTFRTEGSYNDHRRPDSVTFVSDLISDLSRRDFTMNAIAISADGMVSDPYDGGRDIENRIIRCVGDPKHRFSEDALRMFRALRFSARLGFNIEYNTLSAIESCAHLAAELSPERVRDELEKILLTTRPETLGAAISFGLIDRYIPGSGWKTPNFANIALLPRKALPRWAAFSIMLKKYGYIPDVKTFLESLRLDSRSIRCCSDASEILCCEPPSEPLGWKKLLNRYGVDTVYSAVYANYAITGTDFEKDLKSVLKSGECFSLKHLAVNGDDLLSIGLRGPELGEMLNFLLEYVMEYPNNNKREILIELAKYSEES